MIVNGRVQIVDKEELNRHDVEDSMFNPDGYRDVLQGIVIEVEEAYGHCPRAVNYGGLWDTEIIQDRRSSGAHPLRPAPAAPAPTDK